MPLGEEVAYDYKTLRLSLKAHPVAFDEFMLINMLQRNNRELVLRALEQLAEIDHRLLHEPVEDLVHLVGDRELVLRDLVLFLDGPCLQHALERGQKLEQRDLDQRRVGRTDLGLDADAREHLGAFLLEAAQLRGRFLERLVLEQPAHELGAGVRPFDGHLALDRGRFFLGQKQARLQLQQRRRHHKELAGDVEVDLAHPLDVLQVLLGDQCDRNVEDVDLVLADQVQQQIQRAFEAGQRDHERVAGGAQCVERLVWRGGPFHLGRKQLAPFSLEKKARDRTDQRPTAARTREITGEAICRALAAPAIRIRSTSAGSFASSK